MSQSHLASLPVLACLLAACVPPQARAQDASMPQARLEQVARAWVQRRVQAMGVPTARIEVLLLPAARRPPDCARPLQVEVAEVAADERFDRLQLLVRCPGGGEVRFAARAGAYVDAVVARGEVAAGQPLRAEALGTGEQDLAAIPDLLLSPDQAAGYRARRTLRAGQPLRRSLLRGGSAVARGQPLRIVATGQGFQIAIAGTALEDGGVGDSVRIRNTSTGKTTRARVLAPGVVGLEAEAAP